MPAVALLPDLVGGEAAVGALEEGTAADTEWTLGSFKSPTRWNNQMTSRQWTPEQITDTIANGEPFEAPNLVNPNNTATRYEYNGRYIVRDDATNEIIQLGKPDYHRLAISGTED